MTLYTRRTAALTLFAGPMALAACGNGIGGTGAADINARVASTLQFMFSNYPGTRDIAARAAGTLVMPLVTEVGLGLGGSYGRGALLIRETPVDYYSIASASAGLQIGAQQFSHVLFFMTEDSLLAFRTSPGWAVGADAEYVVSDQGETLRAESTTSLSPVIAVIFGQTGLRVGASLEGAKYTRIIP